MASSVIDFTSAIIKTVPFFSSSAADVAQWLGPYMRVSSKNTVQGRNVLEISKSIESNTETTTTQKATTRNAFRQREKAKQKTGKHQHKNGARAQTKTTTESICTRKQWKNHCIPIKACKQTNYLSFFPSERLHGFRQVVPHVGDMLYMRQIN